MDAFARSFFYMKVSRVKYHHLDTPPPPPPPPRLILMMGIPMHGNMFAMLKQPQTAARDLHNPHITYFYEIVDVTVFDVPMRKALYRNGAIAGQRIRNI